MIEAMAEFHFLRPWWLLGFIPVIWVFNYLFTMTDPVGRWKKVIAPHLVSHLLITENNFNWFNPVRLGAFIFPLGIILLAGPAWERQASPFEEDRAALVIALDVSNSMNQSDVQPSRIERAKLKIRDLLDLRKGSLTGLVVYSGTAHTVIPLTNDNDIINNYLESIETGLMPRAGKFPEHILPLTDKLLSDSPVAGSVLLITDGISPATQAAFNTYFSNNAHQLLVLGVGNTSLAEESTDTVSQEKNFIPLDEAGLKSLVSDSRGTYQAMSIDKSDMTYFYKRIDNYLVTTDDIVRPWIDAGYYFIFPIALLVLLWFRRGWTLYWV